jgi:hypothetical protein
MQIQRSVLEVPVSQQQLDGAQVRTGFQHVGCEAVAQRVRADPFADAGAGTDQITNFRGLAVPSFRNRTTAGCSWQVFLLWL